MLNKFSTSTKLYLLIFITAASLIGLGLYAINDLRKMNDNTKTLYADRVLCIQQLSNIRRVYGGDILPIPQSVQRHKLTFSAAKNRVQQAQEIINTNWHNYKLTYLTPQEKLLVKQTDILKNNADKANKNLISILSKGDTLALNKFAQKEDPAEPAPFAVKVTQLMDLQVQVAKDILNNSKELYRITSTNFILVILISLTIALSLSFYIIKNVKNLINGILKSKHIINEGEEKYRSILENASDAIYLVDNKGHFTEVNDSLCKMTGYSKEELLQLSVEDVYDNEQLKTDPVNLSLIPNQSIFKQRRFIRKDGAMVDVEINGKRLDDSKLMGVARDITDRKRMETELREAELKFRTVAEKSMLGVYITQNRRFLYANPRFAEIFGYTSQELMDLSTGIIDTIYAEESRAMIREKIRARDSGETEGAHYEAIGLKKDGTRIKVEFYGNRVTINGQPATIGTTLDITERKKMETQLVEAELKFRTLVEKSMVGVYIAQNEKFVYVNPRLADIFGYTPQEILDLPKGAIEILFTGESCEAIRANLRARLRGEIESSHYRVIGIRKDGTVNDLEIYGNIVTIDGKPSIIGTILDITERKQAEELILKEKELSETIINSLPGIFYLRDEQGRGLRWNRNVEEVTGYTTEEIGGTILRNFVAEEDRETLRKAAETTFKEGYAIAEVQVVTKVGRKIPYLLTQRPVYYGGELCLLGTGIDISQRIKAEEELRLSEQNLERYNRELTLHNKINDVIMRIGDEYELYNAVCNNIICHGGYKLAWICYKPDADADQTLVPLAMAGKVGYLSDIKISMDDPQLSKGPTAMALRNGKTFINNNASEATYFGPWLETASKYGICSSLVLVLDLYNGKTGALTIYSEHTNAFDDREVHILERLASNVSTAVQNIWTKNRLTESEARFRGAFENASIGVGLVSLNGNLLRVNKALCEMLGYDEHELLKLTFQQITHPDDLEIDLEFSRQIMAGESEGFWMEKRYFRKDGGIIWVSLNASLIRDQNNKPLYFLSIIENITEKVESQMKFQNLVENFVVGVYILQNRKLVYVNPRILEETGYSEEEIIDMPYEQFIYKDDRDLVIKTIDAREKGLIDTVRYEARIIKKNGQTLWYEIIGSTTTYKGATALIGTMINVSERKAVYDELIKSEANLRSIFDSSDVSYLLLDTKYNIIALNQQMRDIYRDNVGITLREGDNLIGLIRPERREKMRRLYDSVQLTKKPSGYESSFTDGVARHFAASVFPIIVGDEAIGICISTIDITEQKNALEKLKEANENLQKHAKELAISNAELEQFAYVASHDLQEPLRMVTSFMTQLEKKYGDVVDDKGRRYIHFAVDGAKRMRQIILDLLDFSRVGRTEDDMEEVNFNSLVTEVLALYRRQIEEEHARIVFENLPTIHTYKTPMRQVFQNLISNGLKYHKAGKPPVINISFEETETHFQFSVKDNGIGIAPEYFDKIFIIFQRLHNREEYSGTGMGLAVTKKIVENMGGRIWLESGESGGSIFYFTIPKGDHHAD